MADNEKEFRVPVTVFTTVRAADFGDAAAVAVLAVRRALKDQAVPTEKPGTLVVQHRSGPLKVRVHKVMETGMAAGNGYLWTEATSVAYRELEADRG